jgi:hypothetical protein
MPDGFQLARKRLPIMRNIVPSLKVYRSRCFCIKRKQFPFAYAQLPGTVSGKVQPKRTAAVKLPTTSFFVPADNILERAEAGGDQP